MPSEILVAFVPLHVVCIFWPIYTGHPWASSAISPTRGPYNNSDFRSSWDDVWDYNAVQLGRGHLSASLFALLYDMRNFKCNKLCNLLSYVAVHVELQSDWFKASQPFPWLLPGPCMNG